MQPPAPRHRRLLRSGHGWGHRRGRRSGRHGRRGSRSPLSAEGERGAGRRPSRESAADMSASVSLSPPRPAPLRSRGHSAWAAQAAAAGDHRAGGFRSFLGRGRRGGVLSGRARSSARVRNFSKESLTNIRRDTDVETKCFLQRRLGTAVFLGFSAILSRTPELWLGDVARTSPGVRFFTGPVA